MNRKKIFGFGAVALLIIIGFAPAINGAQLEAEDPNDFNNCSTSDYDLEVELLNSELVSLEPEERDINENGEIDGICSIYYITYTIKNNGPNDFNGPIESKVRQKGDNYVIDYWFEKDIQGKDLTIANGQILNRSHEVEVLTTEDDDNLEDNFDEENIVIDIKSGTGDSNHVNDVNSKKNINYWIESNDHLPTLSQLGAMTPRKYDEEYRTYNGNKIKYPALSKIGENGNRAPGLKFTDISLEDAIQSSEFKDLKNWANSQSWDGWDDLNDLIDEFLDKLDQVLDLFWDEFPDKLNNQRFGWIKDLTRHVLTIVVEVGLFLLVAGSAALAILNSEAYSFIYTWLSNLIDLVNAITAIPVGTATALITTLVNAVFDITIVGQLIANAIIILDLLLLVGGIELFLFAAINRSINQFADWRAEVPWREDIYIHGKVDYVLPGEKIWVECRGVRKSYTAPNGPQDYYTIEYGFPVTAKRNYELFWRTPKRCKINVEGGHPDHEDLSTLGVASYSFSGGKVYKRFRDERWLSRSRDSQTTFNMDIMIKFLETFKDRPIYNLINNFLSFFNPDQLGNPMY